MFRIVVAVQRAPSYVLHGEKVSKMKKKTSKNTRKISQIEKKKERTQTHQSEK